MGRSDPSIERIAELELENARLRNENAEIREENGELRKDVAKLTQLVRELEAKVGQNSSNSSRPPSSDPPWLKPERRANKEKGKRKRGGQPGHRRHERALLPVAEVDDLIQVRLSSCTRCGRTLQGTDPSPLRHQVMDIREGRRHVTEWQRHALTCECGHVNVSPLPVDAPSGGLGPVLISVIGLLSGKYRLSKRMVVEALYDLFQITVSLGSVANSEKRLSEALATPCEQADDYVREQSHVGMDETSWREANKKTWLWIATTPLVTIFKIAATRGSEIAKKILGTNWKGVLNTDRYSAYAWVDISMRQLCWAHLIRTFRGLNEAGGPGSRIMGSLLAEAELMFQWWHRVRDGTATRRQLKWHMSQLKERVLSQLHAGARSSGTRTAAVCANLLDLWPALWTFIDVEGVEPTNNHSERRLRWAVLWRRISFGTQSADGSRFVERMLTVTTTLRQQNRHVLPYLSEALQAHMTGRQAPSLLPETLNDYRVAA